MARWTSAMAGHRADVRQARSARSRPGSSRDLGTAVLLDGLCRLTRLRRCPSTPVDSTRAPLAMRPLHQFRDAPGPSSSRSGTAPGLHSGLARGDVHGLGDELWLERDDELGARGVGCRRGAGGALRHGRGQPPSAPAFLVRAGRVRCRRGVRGARRARPSTVHRGPPLQRARANYGGDVWELLPPSGSRRRRRIEAPYECRGPTSRTRAVHSA